ncbi:unnamed protein product [Periconia digitata]|uniref:Uncharacterized protein n=1 Tax=Periconia digitata TaxID=1303443 RepID=A0A9W4UHB9_9PLEO|nr:unnamed protein product [Periconia digitata]
MWQLNEHCSALSGCCSEKWVMPIRRQFCRLQTPRPSSADPENS